MERITRMTKDEQRAWWKENGHLVGIPSEVSTCQVIGKTTPSIGDGHTPLWFRVVSDEKEIYGGLNKENRETRIGAKPPERGTPHTKSSRTYITPAFDYGHEPLLTREERFLASSAKRQALKELETHGHLTNKTVVLGESVPRHMWWDKERGSHATRRSIGVIVHMADAYPSSQSPDGLVPDTRFVELVALEDLRELLRSHVTDKEMDSLEQSAFGGAVKDRHTLARARRKASKAFD